MRQGHEFTEREPRRLPRFTAWLGLSAALCIALLCLTGCGDTGQADPRYKAIFLDDGRALFARIAHAGPTEVTLQDVIYVEATAEPASGGTDIAAEGGRLPQDDPVRIPADRIVTIVDTDYRAVYFDDGRGLLGKVEAAGPNYVLLGDVRDIHERTISETGERRAYIERPLRWHGSERVFLNTLHIAAMEPSGRYYAAGRVPFGENIRRTEAGRDFSAGVSVAAAVR